MSLKILLVDDEHSIVEIGKQILEQHFHYDVDVAYDGEEAWQKFSSNHYDVVVTDIVMPKMDGLDLILKIRQKNKLILIIAIFGHDLTACCLKYGCMPLQKPFAFEEVADKIQRWNSSWNTEVLRKWVQE